ncbi:MAG: PfkB family carbohydrate kinase [Candidatus Aminicenantes bacterium]|nr:PfkB family carbohydrate kinase [Candidatus Aminicenantes bacterium]
MSLVIIGSLAFDTIETPFGRRERIVGGSGTYSALAASFFTRPRVVGVVGRDFPRGAVAFLKKRGVDLRGLTVKRGRTFHWEGRYGEDPNQRLTVRTDLNVFGAFRPELPAAYRGADIVFMSSLDPDLHPDILGQARRPRLVAMDTIRFWIETKREAVLRELGRVDILFANDEEVKLIAGDVNLVRAAGRILEYGPSLVAAKKGEHGAMLFGRDFTFGVLAHPCPHVIDPTGAGDGFAGGFLGYLDRAGRFGPREFRKAAVYGSVMASYIIEDFGIERLKTLTPGQITRRYRFFKTLIDF